VALLGLVAIRGEDPGWEMLALVQGFVTLRSTVVSRSLPIRGLRSYNPCEPCGRGEYQEIASDFPSLIEDDTRMVLYKEKPFAVDNGSDST
jgi:hypothetical protein